MSAVLAEYTDNRDNNFNLIRFVAASMVLFSHSYPLALGTGDTEPLKRLLGMTWGTVSVDVFFITSGFLVANSLFQRNNILAFTWARVLRIYPALIVAIIFCVFVVGLAFTTNTPAEFLSDPQTHDFFLKNITLFSGVEYELPGVFLDLPYKNAINGSLWTLPYEVKMYFYLTVIGSALVYLHKRTGKNILTIVFLGIAITSVVVSIANHFYPFVPVSFTRLFAMFFVGTAFFICRHNILLSKKLFLLFLTPLLLSIFHKDLFFVAYSIFLPYLVFYIAYVPSGVIRNFNKTGDYSYGIYIYAFPVQQSMAAIIPDISVSTMILLAFPVTFMLSFLSWHLVEKRALKRKNFYVVLEKWLRHIRRSIAAARVK